MLNFVFILFCLHLQGFLLHPQGLGHYPRWSVSLHTVCLFYQQSLVAFMNLQCVFTSHIDEYAFFKVSLMISINTKMPLFQLWASLATWQVKCHTWRFVRRNSSVWKTRPLVRPLGRGQDCLLSGEKPHAILHWCVCILLHKRFFLLPISTSVAQSELSDPDAQTFEPMFRPADVSHFTDSPVHPGRSDDFGSPGKNHGLLFYFLN